MQGVQSESHDNHYAAQMVGNTAGKTAAEQGIVEKDWEQFDACKRCSGGAGIDETPDGDLVCEMCRAMLPRPVS